MDRATGRWRRREDDEIDPNEPPDPTTQTVMAGVKPFVTDSRNLLLLRPVTGTPVLEPFLRTLAYALQRGIQFVYQVEEQEVAVESIGRGDHQRLLLWEAAEGGTGVWERMLAGAGSFAEIAREALRICHCDPLTGTPDPAWDDRCAAACYDCLLSYSNQFDHRSIDRHLVREYLLQLTASTTAPASGQRSYAEQYRWLCERVDPASRFERAFLDHLYQHNLRLPDHAQHRPAPDVAVQPDFYYDRDGMRGICVFVDGPHHDSRQQATRDREAREELCNQGYRVIAIRHDRPVDEQVSAYPEVFAGT
jgi:very-short-patch-repair endonuclease